MTTVGIDIALFDTPEGLAKIKASQEARYESDVAVDWIHELVGQWKKCTWSCLCLW